MFRDWCFCTWILSAPRVVKFSLFYCILSGCQLRSHVSSHSLWLWAWSTQSTCTSGWWTAFKIKLLESICCLWATIPFAITSRAPEEWSVVNASAPSSGSEVQLHCDQLRWNAGLLQVRACGRAFWLSNTILEKRASAIDLPYVESKMSSEYSRALIYV